LHARILSPEKADLLLTDGGVVCLMVVADLVGCLVVVAENDTTRTKD